MNFANNFKFGLLGFVLLISVCICPFAINMKGIEEGYTVEINLNKKTKEKTEDSHMNTFWGGVVVDGVGSTPMCSLYFAWALSQIFTKFCTINAIMENSGIHKLSN